MSDRHPYVIVGPQGVAYVGLHKDETDAWRIYLGWPTVGEVREAKRQGFFAARATLTWDRVTTQETGDERVG